MSTGIGSADSASSAIPLLVLAVVFVLVAVRHVGRVRFQIWQVMCGGEVAVVATGRISPLAAPLPAGSTLAGDFPILGAPSNVIIIQSAEARGETLTFRDFARLSAPLTLALAAVLWAWLAIV